MKKFLVLFAVVLASVTSAQRDPSTDPVTTPIIPDCQSPLPTACPADHYVCWLSTNIISRCEIGVGWTSHDTSGVSGSAIILDLADDASNESTDLGEIAVTNDTNSIFTEPSADKLLIDVSQNWPTCDSADAVAANAVALGTDTTGNYVATITGGNGITATGSGSETAAVSLAVDLVDTGPGMSFTSGELGLLRTCTDGQILKWTNATSSWGCGADSTGAAGSSDVGTVGTCTSDPCFTADPPGSGTNTALVFEGATADDNEITLTSEDPDGDRTITLPNETGTACTTGSVCSGYESDTHATSHESGGGDTINHDSLTGFVANEHIDHSAVTITAGSGLQYTSGGTNISSSSTLATASTENAFLADGGTTSLTCGASAYGKMQVMDDGTLEYCDGATTSVLQSGVLSTTDFGLSIDDTEMTAEDFGDFTCTGAEDQCTIDANAVDEDDLNALDTPSDGECLTYDSTSGQFEWVACAAISGAGGWTDDGTTVRLTDAADEVAIGAATAVGGAKFSVDGQADQDQVTIQAYTTQSDGSDLFIVESNAGVDYFTVEHDGQVGIGQANPDSELHVVGASKFERGSGNAVVINNTSTNTITLAADGGAVFNENSADADFRVESDGVGETHMLFVDASSDCVAVGTSDCDTNGAELEVDGDVRATAFTAVATPSPTITFDDSDSASITNDATISVNATNTTNPNEDTDISLKVYSNGSLTELLLLDGDSSGSPLVTLGANLKLNAASGPQQDGVCGWDTTNEWIVCGDGDTNTLEFVSVTTRNDEQLCSYESTGTTIECDTPTSTFAAASHSHAASDVTSGTLAHERGGLEADVSAYSNGLYGMLSGATADIDTETELETALGGLDVITVTASDITSANLRTALSDEVGTGAAVFESGAPTLTGTNFTGIPSSAITTEVRSMYWGAGSFSSDGTNCADPAEATINSGIKMYTVICTDNDASTVYGSTVLPDGFDKTADVTFELQYVQTAADTSALNADIAIQCTGAGTALDSTWGTEIAIDDAAVTGSNGLDQTTSGAVDTDTTGENCDGGEFMAWRIQLDATGTTTAVATLHLVGLKMEYTTNVGD